MNNVKTVSENTQSTEEYKQVASPLARASNLNKLPSPSRIPRALEIQNRGIVRNHVAANVLKAHADSKNKVTLVSHYHNRLPQALL